MMLRDIADRATRPLENRDFPTAWEIRAADDDGRVTFDGIASVVDTPYMVRDMFGEFTETISRGAFNRTLKQKADVRLLVNHEGVPLARTKSGTLRLSADPNLRAVSELDPKNPDVQRVQSAVGRGDLDQMSIGMRVKDQEWNEDYTERMIREIELFDVSVVTFPASPTTSAGLRSIDELVGGIDGLTADEFKRLMARLEKRFADIYADDVRARLRAALNQRFTPSVNQWIWVRDFTDIDVVFERDGGAEAGTYRLGYTIGSDGQVTLDDAEPKPVVPITTYRSIVNGVSRDLLMELWDRRLDAAA
jgi:HK97 family phage prohead protease